MSVLQRKFFPVLAIVVGGWIGLAAPAAQAVTVTLDNFNSWSAIIEPGATIGHVAGSGNTGAFCDPLCTGPLTLQGIELALGNASTAVFPGVTQLGGNGNDGFRPFELVANAQLFTLMAIGSGNLYEGYMTYWGFSDTNGPLTEQYWVSATFDISPVPVPIPAALWLFGSGLGMLGWIRRRQTA